MLKTILNGLKECLIVGVFFVSLFFGLMTLHVLFNGGVSKVFMNTYTLTDGDKIVVYQAMSHIGSKSFYQSVQKDISEYRNKGYDIFFEGVGGHNSTPPLKQGDKNYEKAVDSFNKANEMFIKYVSEYAVDDVPYIQQSESIDYIKSREYGDRTADLSSSEYYASINNIFKSKTGEPEYSYKKEHPNNPIPALSMMASNPQTDFLSFLIKYPKTGIYIMNLHDFFVFNFFKDYVDPFTKYFIDSLRFHTDVLMNSRNINLANNILDNENKNIYISYGYDHLRGLLKELQIHNSNWKIVKVTEKILISN